MDHPISETVAITQAQREKRYRDDTSCRHARACKAKIRATRYRQQKPYPETTFERFAESMGKDWRNMTDAELKFFWGHD